MAGLVPAIHDFLVVVDVDARHIRAFTTVFDGPCPAMTMDGYCP
jgi:hypothetical protein